MFLSILHRKSFFVNVITRYIYHLNEVIFFTLQDLNEESDFEVED